MKKIITILLTLMLSLSFFACSTSPDNNENEGNNPGNTPVATLEQDKRDAIDGLSNVPSLAISEFYQKTAQLYPSYPTNKIPKSVFEGWVNKTYEELSPSVILAIENVDSKQDISPIVRSFKNTFDDMVYYSLNLFKASRLNNTWVFTSDTEGLKYSLVHDNLTILSNDVWGTVRVTIESEGITYETVQLVEDEKLYQAVIFYKDGEIAGYTLLANLYSKEKDVKSVNFDLGNDEKVSKDDIIGFMKQARKGENGEADAGIKVLYNKVDIKTYASFDQAVETYDWRSELDSPSVLFPIHLDTELVAQETTYEVWSDKPFIYNDQTLTSSVVNGGDRIFFAESADATIKVIKYVNGAIGGVAVVRVKAEETLGGEIVLSASPITISMDGIETVDNVSIATVPKELALAYIDYVIENYDY